jgi:hypothetical protein
MSMSFVPTVTLVCTILSPKLYKPWAAIHIWLK